MQFNIEKIADWYFLTGDNWFAYLTTSSMLLLDKAFKDKLGELRYRAKRSKQHKDKIMGHVAVLFIGKKSDLDYIYENETSDSSSESSAEQAFGYDYLNEERYEKILNYKDSFDKESDVYKNEILTGFDQLEDIIDIRDRDHWSYVNYDKVNKRNRTKEELLNYLEQLPKETPMFLCDGHL